MGTIKGVGENAVNYIVGERNAHGPYYGIFDFVERVNLSAVNRKNIEALSLSGAFDCFSEIRRSQFFANDSKGTPFIDNLLRFGSKLQADRNTTQISLFGEGNSVGVTRPEIPKAEDWSTIEKLNREKELIGIYLSAHPLDSYKLEIHNFCTNTLSEFKII